MTLTEKTGLKIKLTVLLSLIYTIFGCIFTGKTLAQSNQFINIVNPVRISTYQKDPKASLSSQYQIVKDIDLPATWLLTFDVLKDQSMVSIVKNMNDKQELGIFLEVTPNFAKEAGVIYNNSGSWHHANSVFLSGYTKEERIALIDKVFDQFKQTFGRYPTSVGSWWTDSFSLSYMKDKYGIVANLTCSDQFSTDGYQLWGQPWVVPFYPSKYHAGVPAFNSSDKLDLVSIQWAPRDPINGYKNSLFSTQDYPVLGMNLDVSYFEKSIKLYASKNENDFGQITIGLESDLDPSGYQGEYRNQLKKVKEMIDSSDFSAVTMSIFANWYRSNFKDVSPNMKIESNDFLGDNKKVVWYQSNKYRVGVLYDYEINKTIVFDLRIYNKDLIEPYFNSPNRDLKLSINNHSVVDEISDPNSLLIFDGEAKVIFEESNFVVNARPKQIPRFVKKSPYLNVKRFLNQFIFEILTNPISSKEGFSVKDFSAESIHFFNQKKFPLLLLTGNGWNYFKKQSYLVPQGEVEALQKLSLLPQGKVLVFDQECLQCEYHTQLKHPALENRRSYVKKLSKHKVKYNSSFFQAANQEIAKKEFDKLNVDYIYLVKFESYVERLPFSPGDFGVEKVFSNANVEIWKVK